MVSNLPAMQETWVISSGDEESLEKGLATQSSIFVVQYSCLKNPMDRRAWWVTVHGVMDTTELDTRDYY